MCVCKEEDVESEEEDFQVVNVERKTRRSSRRLDHAVPDPVTSSHLVALLFCALSVCSSAPFPGSFMEHFIAFV